MNEAPDPLANSVAESEGKLARLSAQVEAVRAVLVRLLQEVVQAESSLNANQAAQLVQVNEQLLVSALNSRVEAEAAVQALSHAPHATELDALTQLPNRTMLLDRFGQAMANAKRHGFRMALLFLDLDEFKQFNDRFGHPFGDKVLRLVADRLVSTVREVDTVSRHGGDEFLILLAELAHAADAEQVADKLIAAIGATAYIDDQLINLKASIGIAIYPDDGEDVDTLAARADAAMYQAKHHAPGGFVVHGRAPRSDAPEASPAERRHAHLREANERLVLAALTAQELQQAAERKQQRQAAFIAAVADELRDPRAPIRIATSMLGRLRTDEPLLPRVQDIVEQHMAQMSRMVGNLVDSAGLGSGAALALEQRMVDLAPVIEEAVATYRPMMDERRQQFESELPSGALQVRGDAVGLAQIIGNLLDNASKHTHDGGRISLSVVMDALATSLTMTVSDNGIGITPQMLPQIFDPFVQDTHAIGFNGVGLGIGLTVVRALVQAHGGTLVAHSAGSGRGSQFVVTLPLAAGASMVPGAASSSDELGRPR